MSDHLDRLALLNAHNDGLSMRDCVMPIVLLPGMVDQVSYDALIQGTLLN